MAVLNSPFRNRPPHVSRGGRGVHMSNGYKFLSCSSVNTPVLLFPIYRWEATGGSLTPRSGSSWCLYCCQWCWWGLHSANPALGHFSLCQETVRMGWVHPPSLPPPRKPFFSGLTLDAALSYRQVNTAVEIGGRCRVASREKPVNESRKVYPRQNQLAQIVSAAP